MADLNTPEPDALAWLKYPQHRQWLNKLTFAESQGLLCGPAGLGPSSSDWYCVRPVMNMYGMGVGARKEWITDGCSGLEPGYFWCEWLEGAHISATYRWRSGWIPVSAFEGVRTSTELFRFDYWMRCEAPPLRGFTEFHDVELLNIEFIGGVAVEIHFRGSPDPDGDVIIPIWADMEVPEDMIPAFDDGGGHLAVPRLGFVVK